MITFDNFTYSYADQAEPAVRGVSLIIEPGEFVLLRGPSGSGKSTLLKAINGLVPHFYGGRYAGSVSVGGVRVRDADVASLARQAGLVFQDSTAQLVAETVDEEIAFGPENMGMTEREVEEAVAEAVAAVGIESLMGRKTATLSGGEKQKTAIASVLSMGPRALLLDEPLAELDGESADELVELLKKLNRERGTTVVVAEHRTERLAGAATKTLWMNEGSVTPNNPDDGREDKTNGAPEPFAAPRTDSQNQVLVEASGISFSYDGRAVLAGFDIRARAGEVTAVRGRNGSGKTTLLRLICGLLKPDEGSISICGMDSAASTPSDIFARVGYVPQRPSALLFADTVAQEIDGSGKPGAESGETLINELGLGDVRDAYPRDLSWGQQQRVALAAVMASGPRVLLLDEPTHGLDGEAKKNLAAALRRIAAGGAAIIIATHDEEMAAMTADKTVNLSKGRRLS